MVYFLVVHKMPKKKIKEKEIKRIPYATWSNSQLSVAKFYWGIYINGEHYEFDREEVKKRKDQETIYPDLVLYW